MRYAVKNLMNKIVEDMKKYNLSGFVLIHDNDENSKIEVLRNEEEFYVFLTQVIETLNKCTDGNVIQFLRDTADYIEQKGELLETLSKNTTRPAVQDNTPDFSRTDVE